MVLWIGRWPWGGGAGGEKRHISQTSGSQNPWTQRLMGLEAVGRAGKMARVTSRFGASALWVQWLHGLVCGGLTEKVP